MSDTASSPSSGEPSIGTPAGTPGGSVGTSADSVGNKCSNTDVVEMLPLSIPYSEGCVSFTEGEVNDITDVWEGFQMMEQHKVSKENCQSLADIKDRLHLHIQREVGQGKTTVAVGTLDTSVF